MRNRAGQRLLFFLLAVVVFDCILIRWLNPPEEEETDYYTEKIYGELVCFPIPESEITEELSYNYVDSWKAERTFGGERQHEGCDIMMSKNQRGIYPVVSMSDGIIENIGWLKLGGYRIGIRSDTGVYYYYAHMESYAENLKQGTQVEAGEFLGFAGDSGYGSEGTIGQFAVHLHVGIYIPDGEGNDHAINPYPFLQYLEKRHLVSDYKQP